MRTNRLYALIVGVFILSGCAVSQHKDTQELTDIPVKSFESVDVSHFNGMIERAIQKGAKWPLSPLKSVLKVLDAETDTRQISLQKIAEHAENPKNVEVIIIRDGFLDDSVRGDWHHFLLEEIEDGSWRISKIRKSIRCWRPAIDYFQAAKCH